MYQENTGLWAELPDDAQQGDFQTSMILRRNKILQQQIQSTSRWSGHNFRRVPTRVFDESLASKVRGVGLGIMARWPTLPTSLPP